MRSRATLVAVLVLVLGGRRTAAALAANRGARAPQGQCRSGGALATPPHSGLTPFAFLTQGLADHNMIFPD